MSLKSKIVIILSAVVLSYAGLDHLVQQLVLRKKFLELEEREASKDLLRVDGAIQNEIAILASRCDGWAAWDDTYRFVVDKNAAYVASNLGTEAFRKNGINLLFICDEKDQVVWGRVLNLEDEREDSLYHFPTSPGSVLRPENPLVSARSTKRVGEGVIVTEHGPMLVAFRPIIDSRHSEPARGTLFLGRYLDDALLAELIERIGVRFEVFLSDSAMMFEAAEKLALAELRNGADVVVQRPDDTRLHLYSTLPDISGAPVLSMRADIERQISMEGDKSIRYALISTIVAGLLMVFVLLKLLQRIVLGPIAKLTEHAVYIGKSDELTRKLSLSRKDEIGILSREFDSMTEKLSQSRAAVVHAARAAGMSEIATGVLHNVGNVLNSVNVAATLVADKTRNSGLADLRMAMQTVRDSQGDLSTFIANDPRGKYLYPLLTSLTEQLSAEQRTIVDEVRTLTDGIQHIKELIQSQQSYAGRSGVLEHVSIQDEIEKALQITAQSETAPVEIVRDFGDSEPCLVDRHRLLEILVNVIQNARQALAAAERPDAKLVLRIRRADDAANAEDECIRIEIEDNGVGIPPENLDRIFTHGFTTRKEGHGFGLHTSANAATEMGGSLSATSPGPGLGATFLLNLPIRTRVTT
jgi:sensor domain CHASE-containing protein